MLSHFLTKVEISNLFEKLISYRGNVHNASFIKISGVTMNMEKCDTDKFKHKLMLFAAAISYSV